MTSDTYPLLRFVLAVWMAVLGGCVGSFLNVVVYRLPRALSLVHPGSRCPHCQHAIRPYHNIPVLSWFALGGRCHDCRAPIAVRYPLVEALTAVMFAALAWTGPLNPDGGVTGGLADGASVGILAGWWLCGYRLILLGGLLALVLVEWDADPRLGLAFPWRAYVGLALVGLLAPLAWWCVWRAVGADAAAWAETSRAGAALAARQGLAGAASGALLGALLWPATGWGPMREVGRRFATGNLMLVGTFSGPHAVLVLAVAATACYLTIRSLARFRPAQGRPPWSVLLFGLTLGWLVVGDAWVGRQPPGGWWETAPAGLGLLAATAMLSLGTWAFARRR